MIMQTQVSKDIEKFENLERKLRGYDCVAISYYELQRVTQEYREYLRLGTRYCKSAKRLLEIHKIYGGLLQKMKRQI